METLNNTVQTLSKLVNFEEATQRLIDVRSDYYYDDEGEQHYIKAEVSNEEVTEYIENEIRQIILHTDINMIEYLATKEYDGLFGKVKKTYYTNRFQELSESFDEDKEVERIVSFFEKQQQCVKSDFESHKSYVYQSFFEGIELSDTLYQKTFELTRRLV